MDWTECNWFSNLKWLHFNIHISIELDYTFVCNVNIADFVLIIVVVVLDYILFMSTVPKGANKKAQLNFFWTQL